ncbi:MAG TPA: glycosyltransferase family 4 protein [Solirubrobacterales bacterium]|nr:glycosyltransferase family 4 protein [Solirubrobacterales bacterium]
MSKRLLAISHPSVVSVNQEVYRELVGRGWEVTLVVPDAWRHDYAEGRVAPQVLDGMEDSMRRLPVAMRGWPQRHFYLARCGRLCAEASPDVAFVEAEAFSFSAIQWSRALARRRIPFGVQAAENIDRRLPAPVRWQRSRVLRQAAFVAARGDGAARLARAWGARGEVGSAPHAVPGWQTAPAGDPDRPFTVGYAGRLVESKGLFDLLAAVRLMEAPVELLLIGNGDLREQLAGQEIPGSRVRVLDGFSHERMAEAYAQLDVVALPSQTTPTWMEQFGRVIVEALWCGVPVVGSDSGEIPWVIEQTRGGLVFPEGDSAALAARLAELREDAALRRRLAAEGRERVEALFSLPAATDALEALLLRAAAGR